MSRQVVSNSVTKTRRLTLGETRGFLKLDRSRLNSHRKACIGWSVKLFPAYAAVWLYRLSHFLQGRGNRRLSWFVWRLNLRLTGADLDPSAELDGGVLIPYPSGVSITGTAGPNLTVMPLVCVESGLVQGDSAERAWPHLGRDVVLGHHAVICGAVTVADGARIGAGCTVTSDVLPNEVVQGPQTRVFTARRRFTP